jgi:hypothetical protein
VDAGAGAAVTTGEEEAERFGRRTPERIRQYNLPVASLQGSVIGSLLLVTGCSGGNASPPDGSAVADRIVHKKL